jgi:hypothetical protein
MEYTDTAMENAVAITKKIESFLTDCDAYIHGYTALGDINESYLFKVKCCFYECKGNTKKGSCKHAKVLMVLSFQWFIFPSFHCPVIGIAKHNFLKVFIVPQSYSSFMSYSLNTVFPVSSIVL